jgi:hypothetical protein
MDKHDHALNYARERYALACGEEKAAGENTLDALYDIIVNEVECGLIDDATRHADYAIEKHFPRDDWQKDMVRWIRYSARLTICAVRHGDETLGLSVCGPIRRLCDHCGLSKAFHFDVLSWQLRVKALPHCVIDD